MSEVVLDGGGRFSPAEIVGIHTLSLLLSSQAVVTMPRVIQETNTRDN